MTTKGVGILWKTYGENHQICVGFCDFRLPLGFHVGDPGQHQGVLVGYFSAVGSGRVLGCFLDGFLVLFGTLLVEFW